LLRSKGLVSIEEDDGEDDLSSAEERVSLKDHTEHVRHWAAGFVEALGLNDLKTEFESAAMMHDWGKGDERFQALLLGGDRMAARFSPSLWAKSGQIASSKGERERQRKLSGIPDYFRHELLSLQLVESGKGGSFGGDKDLVLHLIAAHHGWARPFAPVVIDDEYTDVNLATAGVRLRWSKQERAGLAPPHRVGSGVGDRFWRLTRKLGWWGLAYVEAVFRLADWAASDQGALQPESEEMAA
jgi:CRISPR-associated endonuclease/helicase Cas3